MLEFAVEGEGHGVMEAVGHRDGETFIVSTLCSHHDDSGGVDFEIVSQEQCVQVFHQGIVTTCTSSLGLLPILDQPHEF